MFFSDYETQGFVYYRSLVDLKLRLQKTWLHAVAAIRDYQPFDKI